jgi:hypothetical protein
MRVVSTLVPRSNENKSFERSRMRVDSWLFYTLSISVLFYDVIDSFKNAEKYRQY